MTSSLVFEFYACIEFNIMHNGIHTYMYGTSYPAHTIEVHTTCTCMNVHTTPVAMCVADESPHALLKTAVSLMRHGHRKGWHGTPYREFKKWRARRLNNTADSLTTAVVARIEL
jgi:hypothetical protein